MWADGMQAAASAVAGLFALCALSGAAELILGDGALKNSVRFIIGLYSVLAIMDMVRSLFFVFF